MPQLSVNFDEIWPRLGDVGIRAGIVLLVLLITWRLAVLLQRAVNRSLMRVQADVNIAKVVARFARWAVWLVGVLLILGIIGVGWAAIGATMGVLGLAAGLALQDVLKNFIAGLYLLAERPFRIGDYVKVKDFTGQVVDVHIRVTYLRTDSGSLVIVPNATMFVEVVVNHVNGVPEVDGSNTDGAIRNT